MAITFYPSQGTVLMCDFGTGFKPPEMVKKRPVVVVSPRRNNAQLCLVIPLSSVEPIPVEDHHHRLSINSMPNSLASTESWAKCDMLTVVALSRLDRVADGRGPNGARKYTAKKITDDDLRSIRSGILSALGLNALTEHLP
jgi:uncharacterized protein YifN (PemK superfamily)